MNSVGIDVSKGKSMIAVIRPFGEVVCSPFEVPHTSSELSALARRLKSLDGETRVVMEATGNYHLPIAIALHEAGIYVSVINAMLVHDYGNNTLRRAKTDKKDAIKLTLLAKAVYNIVDTAYRPLCSYGIHAELSACSCLCLWRKKRGAFSSICPLHRHPYSHGLSFLYKSHETNRLRTNQAIIRRSLSRKEIAVFR